MSTFAGFVDHTWKEKSNAPTLYIAGQIFYKGAPLDSEVQLIDLIECNGIEALVTQLSGDFCLFVIHQKQRKAYLFSNIYASIPIYFHYDKAKSRLTFASTIKQVIDSTPKDFHINWNYIKYKVKHNNAVRKHPTCVNEIYRIKSNHVFILDLDHWEYQIVRNTPFPSTGIIEGKTPHFFTSYYKDLLCQSIEQNLHANHDVLITLSGGFDSSIIFALCQQYDVKLKVASICTITSLLNHEIDRARELSRSYETDHLILPLSLHDNPDAANWIEMVNQLEDIFCSFEGYAKFALAKYANKHYGDNLLVLSGLGSDQFNGGTTVLDHAPLEHGFNKSWDSFMQHYVRKNFKLQIEQDYSSFFQFALNFASEDLSDNLFSYTEEGMWNQYVANNLSGLQKHSLLLESKVFANYFTAIGFPFLEPRLNQMLKHIPADLYPALFFNKKILRKAFENVLPESFRDKPKFYRLPKAEELIFQYFNNLIYKNDFELLRIAFDASPELQHHFDQKKLVAFLDATRDGGYYPSYMHVLNIINLGLLDAHLIHDKRIDIKEDSHEVSFYAEKDKSFDRKGLEKSITR